MVKIMVRGVQKPQSAMESQAICVEPSVLRKISSSYELKKQRMPLLLSSARCLLLYVEFFQAAPDRRGMNDLRDPNSR